MKKLFPSLKVKLIDKYIICNKFCLCYTHDCVVVYVEVGRVWLELPSPIILLNQIQAVLGNPIQLGL